MWLASRAGVFTNFCSFFQLKYFETEKNEKRIGKNKKEILKKVRESIMIEEIIYVDIEKTAKSVKVKNVTFYGLPTNKVKYWKNSKLIITLSMWLKDLGLVNLPYNSKY